VEVTVVPGPNTRGPVFENPVYEVQVSEGASINSTVTTVNVSSYSAPVYYSLNLYIFVYLET
jgi:protocadherin-15